MGVFMISILKKNNNSDINELLDEVINFLSREKDTIALSTDKIDNEIYKKVTQISKMVIEDRENEKSSHSAAAGFLKNISDGKLSDRVDVDALDVAHQDIGRALNQISQKLHHDFNAMILVLKEYQNGVYRNSLDESSMAEGEIKELIKGINLLKDATTNILTDSFKHGMELESSSELLIDSMYHILEASGEQTNVLKSASNEISQISEKALQSSENTKKMQQSSTKVKDSVNQGLEYASKTVIAMQEINNSTNTINEAIDVIDQIAFQTNILSLNAAVEAATAGEAGKGFAVVASEVRNLASRSADAAKKIKELVEVATQKANEGKDISDHMINGYKELSQDIESTIDLIEDTTSSVGEQVKSIKILEHTIEDLNKKTQEYINIAHKANEVSVAVSEISKNISKTANMTEFEGKERLQQNLKEDFSQTKKLEVSYE
jgi:methyl-accepting chemotaxis protein